MQQAFAPATIANVFVGFDILGFCVQDLGDTVIVKEADETTISQISGITTNIPLVIGENTAGKAIESLLERTGSDLKVEISIHKGIPLASGLGGSAASAVAGVIATNGMLDEPVDKSVLLQAALDGEKVASGSRHIDNTAACLYGGLIAAVQDGETSDIINLPIPTDIDVVLIHPHLEIRTQEARSVIADTIPLHTYTRQNMHTIEFIHALYTRNFVRLGHSLKDLIIEPQRKHLIPHFDDLQEIANQHNSMGYTISGAGPTMVGLFDDHRDADQFHHHVKEIDLSYHIDTWHTNISEQGAHLVEKK